MNRFHTFCLLLLAYLGGPIASGAQVVQPVISEYSKTAEGFFQVTNQTGEPEVVTLEPKSFSLDEHGSGIFSKLDPGIHLQLSADSVRLEPQQSARIFYKVNADALPAWLCIYASFSPVKETKGINVRIMLPHTVYLYGREGLKRDDVEINEVRYDAVSHRVMADVINRGNAAGRVSEVEINGSRGSQMEGGFPLLPGMRHTVAVKWTEGAEPQFLHIRFARFQFKLPIPTVTE